MIYGVFVMCDIQVQESQQLQIQLKNKQREVDDYKKQITQLKQTITKERFDKGSPNTPNTPNSPNTPNDTTHFSV